MWGKFVSIDTGVMTVKLVQAPMDDPDTGPSNTASKEEKLMTITLPSEVKMNVEYYVGDVVTGNRVNSEPLFVPNLRPDTLLYFVAVPGDRGQWIAQSVTWRQSITNTPPDEIPTSTQSSVKLRPLISPP